MKTEDRIIHDALLSRIRELEEYSRHQAFVIEQAGRFAEYSDREGLDRKTFSESLVDFQIEMARSDDAANANLSTTLLKEISCDYFSLMQTDNEYLAEELDHVFPERKNAMLKPIKIKEGS